LLGIVFNGLVYSSGKGINVLIVLFTFVAKTCKLCQKNTLQPIKLKHVDFVTELISSRLIFFREAILRATLLNQLTLSVLRTAIEISRVKKFFADI
jgi:hypothetical protein